MSLASNRLRWPETSMGSILGGLYAGGMTGVEIREFAVELFTKKTQLFPEALSEGRPHMVVTV